MPPWAGGCFPRAPDVARDETFVRAILDDLESPQVGRRVFERFTGGRGGTLTYYRLLADLFTQRGAVMAPALELAVERLHALAGEPPCRAW